MNFNFTLFPVLETERLTLRKMNLENATAIFGLRTNKEINEFIDREKLNNLSESRAFINLIPNLALNNNAILKKEFNSFFASPIAYLVIGAFLLINGLFLFVFNDDFNILNAGFADVTPFFYLAPVTLTKLPNPMISAKT